VSEQVDERSDSKRLRAERLLGYQINASVAVSGEENVVMTGNGAFDTTTLTTVTGRIWRRVEMHVSGRRTTCLKTQTMEKLNWLYISEREEETDV